MIQPCGEYKKVLNKESASLEEAVPQAGYHASMTRRIYQARIIQIDRYNVEVEGCSAKWLGVYLVAP